MKYGVRSLLGVNLSVQDEIITIDCQYHNKESISPKINPNLTVDEVQRRMVRPLVFASFICHPFSCAAWSL